MSELWAGVDIGKEHRHCVALDTNGKRLLSRRVRNDEAELLELIHDVLALTDELALGRRRSPLRPPYECGSVTERMLTRGRPPVRRMLR